MAMAKAKFKRLDRLPVICLKPDPNHPRNHPDEGSDDEKKDLKWLKACYNKFGFSDPVTVVKVGDRKFHIIDGVRRARVAEQLGIDYINCIVYEGFSAAESAHLSYQLNSIHPSKSLTTLEKTNHLKKMRDEFGCSYSALEEMGYGSKSEIMDVINLFDSASTPEVQISDFEVKEWNHSFNTYTHSFNNEWRSAFAANIGGIDNLISPFSDGIFEIPSCEENQQINNLNANL